MDADWLLWQLLDSALPTGGFVASSGLEAAMQTGHVSSSNVAQFLQDSLWSQGHAVLPFVGDAWECALDVDKLQALDELLESTLTNHVARRASTAQGGALLLLYNKSFEQDGDSGMKRYKQLVRSQHAKGHLPVVFGVMARSLQISKEKTQRVHLFLFVRAIISAAVRLSLVGPYLAQRLLTQSHPIVESVLQDCKGLSSQQADQRNPLLDIIQGCHDSLYSRLFNS